MGYWWRRGLGNRAPLHLAKYLRDGERYTFETACKANTLPDTGVTVTDLPQTARGAIDRADANQRENACRRCLAIMGVVTS
jgi:hypothetical protein